MKKFIHAPKKVINCVKDDFNFIINLPYRFEKLNNIYLAMDADGTITLYTQQPNDYNEHYWSNLDDYEIVWQLESENSIDDDEYPFNKSNVVNIMLTDIAYNIYELTDYK